LGEYNDYPIMSDESDTNERFYDMVLRQVLWGDSRDEIMHRLEVNGITGEEADKIFYRAMRERVATIRNGYWRRIIIGGIFLVIGIAIFAGVGFLTEGFKVFNISTILVPSGIAAFGAWRFFGGLIGIVTASARTGPISEID
jgi:hypothetical protein